MKYDITKKPTKGALRTLDAFANSMFHMLTQKVFEQININEICEYTNYPRATFYNYFDDKYDLLNYCWHRLSRQIRFDECKFLPSDESVYIFLDRIYDLIEDSSETIRSILQHNTETSYMFSSFRTTMKSEVRSIFDVCPHSHKHPVPRGMIADHYSNTLLLVVEWCFWRNGKCSKQQAYEYLKYLLGDL